MIPKVIHYCWFGGNPLPKDAKKYIESWKKYCPDIKIIEWNESNYNVNCCDYVKEAYEAKKWAFVSDYARFDILYRYGGLYFDTDVEMIKPIDDILKKGPFMGIEKTNIQDSNGEVINPGLGLAATPGMGIYKDILSFYNNHNFYNPDGSLNQTTVVEYTTKILKKYGYKGKNQIQCVDGIYIYPADYFCPMNYQTGEINITRNSRTIHHYSSSWLTDEEKRHRNFEIKVQKIFGVKIAKILKDIYSLPYRIRRKIETKGLIGTIVFSMKKVVKKS
ncbi:glycosyl transferase [Clostridium perfringens]|uniref:Glycosyl transferase n=1 Tax=Clostridium perfringens TaxID=1502 RepID=A0AAN5NC06_CLOPF|nr:glycosyltransferase [Clostridium perfringens]MBO3338126.1 glycosyl transferase [Clostridium perfringens]MBO3385693.1 glycosyl transferase [Clostridium perfringens]MBO3398126.1 glycosyl transferase [Clostridium perfringens]MBO3417189.1 glycosyl transferase [Clostridium perfringens]MBO3420358.1 glycosyl transferase [Clostridium perfringens]